PNEAGTKATNGCPDTDGDGIVNSEDLCPNQYGSAAFKGCPDTDGDGLADPDDRCPTVAGPLSNKGCPELKEEDKKTLAFAAQAIEFETGQAVLLSDSKKILDQVYKILMDYPAYKVRISGHTDSIGDAGANQSLSEKRAKACYDYLVSKGISSSRMSHNGYGESQPIGDNRFKDGRKKNRRTEFNIYLD
ncbi:MAG TPA: OmpA family protein, partial [Saprospiraceae bacterium]|nr:OmpA family protein [Saprospiraceae bacterium]